MKPGALLPAQVLGVHGTRSCINKKWPKKLWEGSEQERGLGAPMDGGVLLRRSLSGARGGGREEEQKAMASLKASPQLGGTSLCVPSPGGTSLRSRGRNAASRRGAGAPGGCPEAAGPAGGLRGRNVRLEALPPPEEKPGDSTEGVVRALSGCFGRSAVIKGCPAGKDPPAPQLFPPHRRVTERR